MNETHDAYLVIDCGEKRCLGVSDIVIEILGRYYNFIRVPGDQNCATLQDVRLARGTFNTRTHPNFGLGVSLQVEGSNNALRPRVSRGPKSALLYTHEVVETTLEAMVIFSFIDLHHICIPSRPRINQGSWIRLRSWQCH